MALRPRVRIRFSPHHNKQSFIPKHQCRRYAAVAAVAPAPTSDQIHSQELLIQRYNPKAPPSLKAPDLRKSQLLRQYTSLINSSALTLYFQHNSLKATEWAAIRRELADALHKVSSTSSPLDSAQGVRLQVIHAGIYAVALRIVEFYEPSKDFPSTHQQDTTAAIHAFDQHTTTPTHVLSAAAHEATLHPTALKFRRNSNKQYSIDPRAHKKRNTAVHALLRGPVAAVTFPSVSPQQLAAALSILSPTPGASSAFPAPRRAANPRYYDPSVQTGLQKLILLGARVEGRALDGQGVRWVGGLASQGGLEGLRAQLVATLQRAGAGLTSVLEGASRSLWVTMESRKISMEEQSKNDGENIA